MNKLKVGDLCIVTKPGPVTVEGYSGPISNIGKIVLLTKYLGTVNGYGSTDRWQISEPIINAMNRYGVIIVIDHVTGSILTPLRGELEDAITETNLEKIV